MGNKLFLGISLNKQQREQVIQLQNRLCTEKIKPVVADNLHMTLAFFGQVSVKNQRRLEKQLTAINKQPFSVLLDRLSYWQKPKILCISGDCKDSNLLQLVESCRQIADKLKLHRSHPVFRPHITLARKAQHSVQFEAPALQLTPKQVHLFASQSTQTGVKYEIQRSWQLGASQP